jgi:hypothetical protein
MKNHTTDMFHCQRLTGVSLRLGIVIQFIIILEVDGLDGREVKSPKRMIQSMLTAPIVVQKITDGQPWSCLPNMWLMGILRFGVALFVF